MVRTQIKPSIIAALAFVVVAGGMTTEAVSKNSKTGAVVGGLIAGAAIGAAISSSSHPTTVYVEERPKPNPNKWGESFSPKPGIRCYPAQHACYNNDGAYNGNWTYKVYAR
jgi:hypothetical protein